MVELYCTKETFEKEPCQIDSGFASERGLRAINRDTSINVIRKMTVYFFGYKGGNLSERMNSWSGARLVEARRNYADVMIGSKYFNLL